MTDRSLGQFQILQCTDFVEFQNDILCFSEIERSPSFHLLVLLSCIQKLSIYFQHFNLHVLRCLCNLHWVGLPYTMLKSGHISIKKIIVLLQNFRLLFDWKTAGAPKKRNISSNTCVTCSIFFKVKCFKMQNLVKLSQWTHITLKLSFNENQ